MKIRDGEGLRAFERGRLSSAPASCAEAEEHCPRHGSGAATMDAFAGFAQNRLYSGLAHKAVILLSGQSYAQAYLPTQPPPPFEGAWLSRAYEDQGWSGCAVAPSRQGTAPCLRVARLPRLIRKGSRPLAPGRQDATDAKLLSQCLLPLPLRCPRHRQLRNQRLGRICIRRSPRMRVTGGCTSTPTTSACTRQAGSSSRHR